MNQVTYRPKRPESFELRFPNGTTFHATWGEAHAVIVARCKRELEQAEKQLAAATRAMKRAEAMKPPELK